MRARAAAEREATKKDGDWVIEFRTGSFFQSLDAEHGGPLATAQRFATEDDVIAFFREQEWLLINGATAMCYPPTGAARGAAKAHSARCSAKANRCDRYEAPGPALLKAEHAEDCYVTLWERSGREPFDEHAAEGACDCGRSMREEAYREQHARDVAIVEAVKTIDGDDFSEIVARAMKRDILCALKGDT